ncbi:MAG: helix-turn-helix domain-containing protein [Clostridia bacterium]
MAKEIINIQELSSYLKISIPEIRKLVRQSSIPYFRIGNRLKFDLANINLWIEELEEKNKKILLF